MQAVRKFLTPKNSLGWTATLKRNTSTALVPLKEIVEKQNYLFAQEQKKQLEEVGRVEKITVQVIGPPEDIALSMNQNISTPFDCCRHISGGLCQQTPLALVNDEILWDMHRPLPASCSIRFLNFKDENPYSLNDVFWRTGSLVLGAVIMKAFKDDVNIFLHSFPDPHVKSGSFIYDTIMLVPDWRPTLEELKVLSAEFISFVRQNHKIECLSVTKSVAYEMFKNFPAKVNQLSKIADQSKNHKISLYKVGNHIDISSGPMIGDTSFFGKSAIAAVHRLDNGKMEFYRFQGVALPKGIMLNNYAFEVLIRRAEVLNEALPPYCESSIYTPYGPTSCMNRNSKINVQKGLLNVNS